MPVNLSTPKQSVLLPIAGIKLGIANAGIKSIDRADLVLIQLDEGTTTATIYTQNALCAAPVTIAKRHQHETSPRYLLINSGNANAGTGEAGLQAAQDCCQAVADLANSTSNAVLPFSTGVIGQQLPVSKIKQALPDAYQNLTTDNWFAAESFERYS